MALIMKQTSQWWYGLFSSNGSRKSVNLGVKVEGSRPASLGQRGDDDFERSRGKAIAEYERRQEEFTADRTGERALRKLAEIKAGREVIFPRLADLPRDWESIPRRKAPSAAYARACRVTLERFGAFVAEHQPDATEFVAVKPDTAKAFMAAEAKRGVSPKTWNDSLKLLRATFKHLHPHLNEGSNPFHGLVTKATETVNREPFSVEEMKAILAACADDDFIRPVIVTGMCTAMRRGDCCLLKWEDVDHQEGFITVKTAKTGETVDIPMFPMLREELGRLRASAGKSAFCFPLAAEMYQNNPDGITWRVKQVIARALDVATVDGAKQLVQVSPEEVRSRGLAYIGSLGDTAKAGRMRQVFSAYMEGKTLGEVMAETGCSKGTVSGHLNEVESQIGCAVVRGNRRKPDTDALQAERQNGTRKASIRDFHSFRVTWITLALAAGVPLELVQRVTGHRTVEVVMKHYFRPGREDFRSAILKAMPKMLADGGAQRSVKEELREILGGMTADNWRRQGEKALEIVAGM